MRDATPSFPFATAILAMACLAAGFTSLEPQFAFDRQNIMAGELWRLWTGHLVHFSLAQRLLDVGTLLIVGWLAEREWGSGPTAIAMLLGMPAISASLLLVSPDLIQFRGVSGIVMLLALAAATSIWHDHPSARPGLAVLGVAAAIKTLLDASGMQTPSSLPAGVSVAWQAHVSGAAIGWMAARYRLQRMPRAGEAGETGIQKL
ncbi:rhombosortase [Thiobacillus sp.]|uniref:rhombosortase n=1 Tax=Thiobacillus sp. TaxID=924 RepID=UPI001D5C843D|nr:rhombosortase [Thiobacillus sp.]MBC2760173.1 rhombosortase [Thiobacillus sp.]